MKQDDSNTDSLEEAWEGEAEAVEEAFEDWILSNTEEEGDDDDNDDAELEEKEWLPYEGPRGGTGWRNTITQRVVYLDEPPETQDDIDVDDITMDDVMDVQISGIPVVDRLDARDAMEGRPVEIRDSRFGVIDGEITEVNEDSIEVIDETGSYQQFDIEGNDIEAPVYMEYPSFYASGISATEQSLLPEEGEEPNDAQLAAEALRRAAEIDSYYETDKLAEFVDEVRSRGVEEDKIEQVVEAAIEEHPALQDYEFDEIMAETEEPEQDESEDEEGNEYSVEEAEEIASDVLGVPVDSSNFDSVEELISVFESTVDDDRFDTTEEQMEELREELDVPSKDEVSDFGRNERRPTVDLPTPDTDLNTEPFDTDDYGDVWDNTEDIDALRESAFDRLSEEHDKEAVGLTKLTLENWERKGYSYIEEIWSAAMAFNDVDTVPNHFVEFGKTIDPDEKVHNTLYDMMELSQSQAKEDFGESVTVYRAFEKSTIEDYAQKNDDGSITVKPQVLESWSIEEDVTRKHARQRSDESDYVFAEQEVSTDEVGFYGPFAIGGTTKAYKELTLSRTDEYTIDGENLENYDPEEFKMKQDIPVLPVEESDWIRSPDISPDMFKSWVPYVGPREGTGWQSTEDPDNVVYDEEPPGEMDVSAMDIESMGNYLAEVMGESDAEKLFTEAADQSVIEEAVEAAASEDTEIVDVPPVNLEPGTKALFPKAGVVNVRQEVNDSTAIFGPNVGYLNLEGDYVATLNGDRTTDEIPEDAEVLSLMDVWEVQEVIEYTPEAADIDSVDFSDSEERKLSNAFGEGGTTQRLTQEAHNQLWGELGKIHLDAAEEMRTLLQETKKSSYSTQGRKREMAFLDAIGREDLDVRNGVLTGEEPDEDLTRMANEIVDVSRRAFEEQFGEETTVYRGISNTAFEQLIEEAIESEDGTVEFDTYGMTNFATEEGVGEKFAVTRKTANVKRQATVDDVLSWTDYIINAMNEAEISLIGGSTEIPTAQIDIPWTGNTLEEELEDPSEDFLLGLQERGLREQFEMRDKW